MPKKLKQNKRMIKSTSNGRKIRRKKLMMLTKKSKIQIKLIKRFGRTTIPKTRLIGNKNIDQISYNGSTGQNNERLEIKKEIKEEKLQLKNKSKEKNKNN